MSDDFKCLMVGLPEAGKTTFLAATYYVVRHPDEVPEALRLSRLKGDDHYLGRICDEWQQYLKVERTKVGAEGEACMELRDDSSGKVIEVVVPDLSGERFREQVEERHTTRDFVDLLNECDGVLMFLHVEKLAPGVRIDQADPLVGIITEGETAPTPTTGEVQHWDPKMMPGQVKLVELFQILKSLREQETALRVGLILSAWDLVPEENGGPDAFVQTQLPLLHQFLETNMQSFEVKMFGVSAQGAPLENEADRRELAAKSLKTVDRIGVHDGSGISNDITLPIKWLMKTEPQ